MNRLILVLLLYTFRDIATVSAQGIEIYQMKATDEYNDTLIIDFQQQVTLDFKKTHITFLFRQQNVNDTAALQYQLIPFDRKPFPAHGNYSANYINLPGGSYTFRVSELDKPERKSEVNFMIREAFWQEGWFIPAILGYVLILIGFVWFSIRTVKYRQQLRMQDVRNRIAADLHDDIGGTLANISLLMSVAESQKDPEMLSRIHQQVNRDAKDTMLNMRGMLMAIHPGNDKGIDFFEKIRSSFYEALQFYPVQAHFDFQLPEFLKLTMEQQRNIFLLYKEIINNTLKHAEARQLKSVVRVKEDWLMIVLEDDGHGFDQETQTQGNGLRNIKSRVKEIHGTLEIFSGLSGTRYQIAIPIT